MIKSCNFIHKLYVLCVIGNTVELHFSDTLFPPGLHLSACLLSPFMSFPSQNKQLLLVPLQMEM